MSRKTVDIIDNALKEVNREKRILSRTDKKALISTNTRSFPVSKEALLFDLDEVRYSFTCLHTMDTLAN